MIFTGKGLLLLFSGVCVFNSFNIWRPVSERNRLHREAISCRKGQEACTRHRLPLKALELQNMHGRVALHCLRRARRKDRAARYKKSTPRKINGGGGFRTEGAEGKQQWGTPPPWARPPKGHFGWKPQGRSPSLLTLPPPKQKKPHFLLGFPLPTSVLGIP